MSIHTQISGAIAELRQDPPADLGGVFTEIEIVLKAERLEWSDEDWKTAQRAANNLCGTRFRARKLCRYGPVDPPDGPQDYARIASKIVYADARTGPDYWETPNGRFPKLMFENELMRGPGRKSGVNRNDLVSWDEQTSEPFDQVYETSPSS